MTAKQKAARARFKSAIAEAKKLRAKNPKLSQAQAVKQAWAILYSKDRSTKKVGSVKKKSAPKRKAATKKAVSTHKDTKSHNVNIRVMSGTMGDISKSLIKKLNDLIYEIYQRESVIKDVIRRKKELIDRNGSAWYKKWISDAKKTVSELKKHKNELKKLI